MLTLFQIIIASFLFIILPLFKTGWKGKNKYRIAVYFTGIGIGYMFIEMVLIQRFILYFGNPVYSVSAVITTLLVFSGLGSYYSAKIAEQSKRLRTILAVIVFLVLLYAVIVTPVLRHTVQFPTALKIVMLILLTAPLAFLMGIPFPAALSRLSANEDMIPWAWAINGCMSVISTALATIVAVEMGFIWVMVFSALAYCLPWLVVNRWKDGKA